MLTKVQFNRGKLIQYFITSLVFVLGSLWLIFLIPKLFDGISIKAMLLFLSAIFTVLLFGFIGYAFLDRLISDKPAIMIEENGMINNLPGYEMMYIPWSIIEDFEMVKSSGQFFIMVKLNNPVNFIIKQEDVVNRFLMKMNQKYHGSPICINGITLKGSQEDLFEKLCQALEKYHENNRIS